MKEAIEENSNEEKTETVREFPVEPKRTEEATSKNIDTVPLNTATETRVTVLSRSESSDTVKTDIGAGARVPLNTATETRVTVLSRSESSDTVKTDIGAGAKPKSSKKVRAPLPPGHGSQSSLIAPTESIIHLSPTTTRKEIKVDQESVNDENPEQETVSGSKVLNKSRGYDEDNQTEPEKPKQSKQTINIKNESLEKQMLQGDQVTSKTFMRNQDFLQPLIKDREATLMQTNYYEEFRPRRAEDSESLIKENYPGVSSTRIFSFNPDTGTIENFRKYDVRPTSPSFSSRPISPSFKRPSSPISDRSRPSSPYASSLRATSPSYDSHDSGDQEPVSAPVSRCPHCTIHTWLPHSPACPNRGK